jgi:hypothetical protein
MEESNKNINKNINNIYSVLDNYTSNDELRQALKDFLEMRKKLKKPITDRAFNMLLSELNKLAATDDLKVKLLDQSILHNWQTVYPLKVDKQDKPTAKPNKFHNIIEHDRKTESEMEELAQRRMQQKLKEIQERKNI